MEENKKLAETEISKKGNFLKWLDNYWYHYKWHTIIVGIVAVILIVCFWQMGSTKKHDTVIVYAGPMCLTTNETLQLQEVLSGVLPSDKDKNGEKSSDTRIKRVPFCMTSSFSDPVISFMASGAKGDSAKAFEYL